MGAYQEYYPYDLKKFRLPSQFIVITAEQGQGKTSLGSALLCDDYKYHRAERRLMAWQAAEEYSRNGNVNLTATLPEHVYFSSGRIILDPKSGTETHYIDLSRFALPNDDFEVQYFPRGSVVFLQEAHIQLYCRNWNDTTNYLINLMATFRHNQMTIIFDTQDLEQLDAAARRLATNIFELDAQLTVHHAFLWFGTRATWTFTDIKNQRARKYRNTRDPKTFESKRKYTFKGDIFSRYDSFSCAPYYYYGIVKKDANGDWVGGYKVQSHPKAALSPNGVTEYVKLHPLKNEKQTKPDKPRY